jgi:hypothetical protein
LPKRPGAYHHISEGELVEHRRDGTLIPQFYPETRKLEFYAMLVHIGRERGQGRRCGPSVQRQIRPLAIKATSNPNPA